MEWIAVIVVFEVTTVVATNLSALAHYVKSFGVKQGFEMYKYLGAASAPNGVISLIEMDMADGDSSLDDFWDGHFYIKPKLELKFDSQQLGGKWGKHRYDYPELTSYKEYEQLARTVFNNPDKIVFCGSNQEYLYIRGNELLRVTFNGEFVSMYPGSNTDLVKKALEAGGLLWER